MSPALKIDWERVHARTRCIQQIRHFLTGRGVQEVDTPVLARTVGTDPHLDFFEVPVPGQPVHYLQTSPEFAMKQMLAAGSGPIFQICKAFRMGDVGRWHNPEFTLLEWYRPHWTFDALIQEVLDLCMALRIYPAQPLPYPVVRCRYADLFHNRWGWDPLEVSDAVLHATVATHIPEVAHTVADRDTALQWLMAHVIEPTFQPGTCYVITHYPASQAALARLDPVDPRCALRFELYAGPLELANGYDELTDPVSQQARFEADNRWRRDNGKPTPELDQQFLAALSHMPPCVGVAMGVDRLVALHLQENGIDALLPFRWKSA